MSNLRKLCDAVSKAALCKGDAVPDGWHTCKEIAKVNNKSIATTVRKLNMLEESGIVESRKYKIMTNRGYYPTLHYRYVETKKKPA